MKETQGHSDLNRWPEIMWRHMIEISGTNYIGPTFEAENDEDEVDDAALREATIQHASLKSQNQILLARVEDMVREKMKAEKRHDGQHSNSHQPATSTVTPPTDRTNAPPRRNEEGRSNVRGGSR